MAGGPRRGGRRRKKYAISQQMVLHIDYKDTELLNVLSQNVVKFYHVV